MGYSYNLTQLLQATATAYVSKLQDGISSFVSPSTQWVNEMTFEVGSTATKNVYPVQRNMTGLNEWLGERTYSGVEFDGLEVINKDFEGGLSIKINDIEDNNLISYDLLVAEKVEAVGAHEPQKIAELLATGTSWVDGAAFWNASRVYGSATIKNLHALPLTADNFYTVRKTMLTHKSNVGLAKPVYADTLIVPASLEKEGKSIVQSLYIPDSVTSTTVTNIWQNAVRLLVVPELDVYSTTSWYLAKCGTNPKGIKPVLRQLRKPMEYIKHDKPTDENVRKRREIDIEFYKRCAWTLPNPYMISKSTP